jgi:hypothetical protein
MVSVTIPIDTAAIERGSACAVARIATRKLFT